MQCRRNAGRVSGLRWIGFTHRLDQLDAIALRSDPMSPAFRFLARGKVNVGDPDARARPKSSIASFPEGSTAIGLRNRFTVVAFKLPTTSCQRLSSAPFR